jgi:DNA-directed RNA polymerase alpha subunit
VKELKNMLKTSESVGSVNSLKKDLAELELEYLSMNNKKKNKFHTVGKVAFSKGSPKGSD